MASRAAAHLINVGHGNVVVAEQVVAIVALDSLPVKRLIESAKGSMKLVDATNGRRTRAVIVTGSDHLILSSLEPATLARYENLRSRHANIAVARFVDDTCGGCHTRLASMIATALISPRLVGNCLSRKWP